MSVVWPVTCTRRIGAAWDTAQNSPEVQPAPAGSVTWMCRLEIDRQKLFNAMQLPVGSHWLRTLMEPLMTTSFGDNPSPATLV